MIHRRENTVLILKDNYPEYDVKESDFLEQTFKNAGYYVRYLTVQNFIKTRSNQPNAYLHQGFLLVVPNCRYLPLETCEMLRRYNESAGSVLFLGGPLYYHCIRKEEDRFVEIPLKDMLDASFTLERPYVCEGIAPSYKTYAAKKLTKADPSPDQNFFNAPITLPGPTDVTVPCETGIGSGYVTDSNSRFIPVVDCFDNNSDASDLLVQGRCGGRRGSLAYIVLQRTRGEGREGNNDYGMVDTTTIGSAAAAIGAECPIYEIGGADKLLVSIANRIRNGLFLMEGGANGLVYRKGEAMTVGAQVMNTTFAFQKASVTITVDTPNGPLSFTQQKLICPKVITDISFQVTPEQLFADGMPMETDYPITVTLSDENGELDHIHATWCMEDPVPVTDPDQFVATKDDYFTIDGTPWYMAGINYWSTWNPALEKQFYWLGQFDRSNYSPKNVEDDLTYMEKIGINCVLTRMDFTDMDRIVHGVRDFLIRCRRHHMRVWVAFTKATRSKVYCAEAVEELFSRIFVSGNPTVMALDLEWESQDNHHHMLNLAEEFNDEWQDWLIRKYGSIEAAEAHYGYPLPRDEYGFVAYPPFDLKSGTDIRLFAVECIDRYWEPLMQHLRPLLPNQLITFRHGGPCTDGPAQAASFIDLTPLEIYGLLGYEKDIYNPENHINAVGSITSGSMIQKYETGGKPVVWAEYGYTVCGAKWTKVYYDHENRRYYPEDLRHQRTYNQYMCEAIEEAHCAGSSPWWWCGGFRYTEMADFGYMMPDGQLSESGRDYAQFCQRMCAKAGQPDLREAYVYEGNVFAYPDGKKDFIKAECVPAFREARAQGKRLVIKTRYDEP